jgi:DNA-directed RNA polymerase subunit RPC12/RpoP
MLDFKSKRKKYPSRAYRLFGVEPQLQLFEICKNDKDYKDQYDKIDDMVKIVKPLGLQFLGAGSNRIAFRHGLFAFKVALDYMGWNDNIIETRKNIELRPYGAIKCYETNGLIMGCDYVSLIPPNQFEMFRKPIIKICEKLSKDYVFADLGYSTKNQFNWGFDLQTGKLKFLDFAYIFKKNKNVFLCPKCHEPLCYDENYVNIICPDCGSKYSYFDVKYWHKTNNNTRENIFKENKEKMVVTVDENAFKLNNNQDKMFLSR